MPALTLEEYRLAREDTFTISHEMDTNNGNLVLSAQAPSNKSVVFYFAEMTNEAAVTMVVHNDVENVSGGTDLEPSSNAIGSDNTADGTYKHGATFDSLNEHQSQTFTGEATHNIFDGYRVELLEGERLIIEVQNTSGGNNTVSVRAALYEQ